MGSYKNAKVCFVAKETQQKMGAHCFLSGRRNVDPFGRETPRHPNRSSSSNCCLH